MNKILITYIFLLLTNFSFGQKTISMLNNRFSFSFPDSAKIENRESPNSNIETTQNFETRVVYNEGKKKIVFYAQDLFMLTTENLEFKILKESTKENPYTVNKKDNQDSTLLCKMNFQKFKEKEEVNIMYALIIKNVDNTLSRLTVYYNQEAFADRINSDSITNQVFENFTKGTRTINLEERLVTLSLVDTKVKYDLKLPKNYFLITDKQKDFDVYSIKKFNQYGMQESAEMVIYFGKEPKTLCSQMKLDSFKTSDTKGLYLQQNSTWKNYFNKQRSFYLREKIFTNTKVKKDIQNHVAMMSNNAKLIEELTIITKTAILK